MQVIHLFCVFGLLFSSCRPKKIDRESPELNFVKKGSKFRVNLAEKPSNGESWVLRQDFNIKVLDQISTIWHGDEKGLDFNFFAADTGQTGLHFALIKYRDTLDVKTFIVKISEK
mgnify:CR=1 FL=1